MAEGLGVKVFRLRPLAFALAIVLIAPVVATCGPIGFIALNAPHLARAMLGSGNVARLLPVSALAGACLLAVGDLAAREALRVNRRPKRTPQWSAPPGVDNFKRLF